MSDKRLLPCPFCGGYVHEESKPYFRDYMLYCEGCDMYFALDSLYANMDDLIEKFNRRADDNTGD